MKILGVDGGITSVGWSLIESVDETGEGRVLALGARIFDAPEEKTNTGTKLKSAERRTFRGTRRNLKRRRQRMNAVRALLAEHGLLPDSGKQALAVPGIDPWRLRVEALDRKLEPLEMAVVLGHIAKHRAFKSNAKDVGRGNKKNDDSKMLSAVQVTNEKLAKYRTPAEMLQKDEAFIVPSGRPEPVRRFRNRDADYTRSLLRDDLRDEVAAIFRAQRRHGGSVATEALETRFVETAFFQRPLQGVENLVGYCGFEQEEKRTCKAAYSFELFRYLSRLNALTLRGPGSERRRLNDEERKSARALFGQTASIKFKALRKAISLPAEMSFETVKADEEGKRDVTSRSGESAAGTARLQKLIVQNHGAIAWHALLETPEKLDRLAEIISFREDLDEIRAGLMEAALPLEIVETVCEALKTDSTFEHFHGTAHISAKAARAILPGLELGETYDKACARAGYDHTASATRSAFDVGVSGKEALKRIIKDQLVTQELVGSPTARKALIELLKQIKAVIEIHGLPDRIHVELARDVGKSIEERGMIERGIERRNKQKDALRDEFADKVGRPLSSGSAGQEELLRYELWKEQNGRCLYTDTYISPQSLVAGDNSVQVDHILPWSRFGDDSFLNKSLCIADANQRKSGQTPFEWFQRSHTAEEWERFVADVERLPGLKGMKRRNYLLRNAEERAEKFRSRNLNDTRWTCRLALEALRQVLPDQPDKDGKLRRRVFARPGALTNLYRKAWGFQGLKKDAAGKRIPDDRHHALDATIVAAISEAQLQRSTREVQELESKRRDLNLARAIQQPWPGFRVEVLQALDQMLVSRAPRLRARGAAHQAKIYQVRQQEDGKEIVYERVPIAKLVVNEKRNDLARIKGAERNQALIKAIGDWIEAGKPADKPPLSPAGDPISKVRLRSTDQPAVRLANAGSSKADSTMGRGEMARVDVFRKPDRKGRMQFYLVPIYPHDVAKRDTPPNRASSGGKPEEDWPVIDDSFEFLWPLVINSYVSVTTGKGEVVEGYFRGMDRSTGAIQISAHHNSMEVARGIGARSLLRFEKLEVDRMGGLHRIDREARTWRGKVCT